MSYQPKTGQPCHCRKGVQRDNCPECEGTGWRIDFKAIRGKRQQQFGRLTRPVEVKWGPQPGWYCVTLPAGIRCRFMFDPSGGRWVADEFPDVIFKDKPIEKHDAVHYGLTVPADAVEVSHV